ncbi:MAG TPA: hypothetical protein VMF06_04735 [Candidatus Limnocylindria bacterium]|nr:hypothetical protein [Candidatus Limnocylindria bacterium]
MTSRRLPRNASGIALRICLHRTASIVLLAGGIIFMIYGNFANASRQGATGMIAGGTIATLAGLITTLYAWKPAREPGSHSRARYRGSR